MPFTSRSVANKNNKFYIGFPQVTIQKASSFTVGQIGMDITYTLTVTVPAGTVAYRVTVEDILPEGQIYIGPAIRQVPPGPATVIPTSVNGQIISFLDGNQDIDASTGTVIVVYIFIARIINATHSKPYFETQTNTARMRWATVPDGPLNQEATAAVDIIVQTPNITILKEQRNVSTGGSFTTDNINALSGNTIYYRFTITSNGTSPAYNIKLTDILDSFLTYNEVIFVSDGTVTPSGSTLEWSIPVLPNGDTAILVISVSIVAGVGAGGLINNFATATYDSSNINPDEYKAISNTVSINIRFECILANKVFSQCQKRICIKKIKVESPAGYNLTAISYGAGKILPETLRILHLAQRPGFIRVSFDVDIPFTATFKNPSGDIVTRKSNLPHFNIDTILYFPKSRSEIAPNVVIDTRSSTLGIDSFNSTFTVGVIVVVTVTSLVQLLISDYGYCIDSCECEEYQIYPLS